MHFHPLQPAMSCPELGVHYEEFPPHEALAGSVLCLWRLRLKDPATPFIFRGVPDGCVDIVFPADLFRPATLVALLERPVSAPVALGGQRYGVRFPPGEVHRFFSLPPQIHDRQTLLEDLGDPDTPALEARLFEAATWPARVRLLQRFLTGRLERNKAASPRFKACLQRILETGGSWPLARIAREEGLGVRHLHRLFEDHLGANPRTFSRVIRFQAALRRLSHGSWQEVEGYCDQSHLIREFRAFYGDTPGAFRSRSVQYKARGVF